ncbi:AAA family ATPase [Pseudomonas sp. GL-RE-29]|uniref:AAA family ATPase n=1 Tax=Pseudomonas sp. GL-RE-29 TaxID=2832375 RepID=UPI001CBC8A9D|nr:AAA family ATPase [Pseudomonas sp. GL-RE-29]
MSSTDSAPAPIGKIKSALASISPGCDHDTWFKVCAAIHSELGEDGRDLCEEWSAKGTSYDPRAFNSMWRSLKPGAIGIGTLFHIAQGQGWVDPGGWPAPDPEDLVRNLQQKIEQEANNHESDTVAQAKAAELAAQLMTNATQPKNNPYLNRKGVHACVGLWEISANGATSILGYAPRSTDGDLTGEQWLLAPIHKLFDGAMVLTSVELIDPNGRKTSLPGQGTRSSGFVILDVETTAPEKLVIVEGVATGLSVLESTGLPVFCALSCTNIGNVAGALREKWPNAEIVIGADLRKNGSEPHPDAVKAAMEVRALLAVPLFGARQKGDDFNDLHQQEGLDAVRRCVAAAKHVEPDFEQPTVLHSVDLSDVMTAELEPVRFIIDRWFPARHVTLLGGHGGGGKSCIALVMAAHVACGQSFAGRSVEQCRVVYVSLEDEPSIVRYRLKKIITAYGLPDQAVLSNLVLLDGTGGEPTLIEGNGSDKPRFTATFRQLCAEIQHAGLVFIDNASDAFGANEISRRDVRMFIRGLARGIAVRYDAAVVLLAHIDKAAAREGAKGNSYSGSTAWHNSTRSRLALLSDKDVITIEHEKHNLSAKAEPLKIAFNEHGVPMPLDAAKHVGQTQDEFDQSEMFKAFKAAQKDGVTIPASVVPGAHSAMSALSNLPEYNKIFVAGRDGKLRAAMAITALLRAKVIGVLEYSKPNRHPAQKYVVLVEDYVPQTKKYATEEPEVPNLRQ